MRKIHFFKFRKLNKCIMNIFSKNVINIIIVCNNLFIMSDSDGEMMEAVMQISIFRSRKIISGSMLACILRGISSGWIQFSITELKVRKILSLFSQGHSQQQLTNRFFPQCRLAGSYYWFQSISKIHIWIHAVNLIDHTHYLH